MFTTTHRPGLAILAAGAVAAVAVAGLADPIQEKNQSAGSPASASEEGTEGEGRNVAIVIDNRPERGVPPEALVQIHDKRFAAEEAVAAREFPETLRGLTAGTIKSVRIRYFNKETWATEKAACGYVARFLDHKSLHVFGFQIWSQTVDVPEIECLVDFTEEHRKALLAEQKPCREGRLLIWNTEACYRDATGRWWFVNAFDHFHRWHPKGDRKLARDAK